ncbi:DNA repair protein RAD51 homolog 2-like [Babylonia areolata]|uniref:DNA repair protein RAD51 homolog 2-like n=1 Tax=Babylonia areolata TaxID=304850 RepID=UPI003FD468EB
MTAKRLQRLDIRKDLQDRLARQGLMTCADVLSKSQLELMKLSGSCGLTIQDIHHKCCLAQAVSPITALALWRQREKGGHYLATSLPDLDRVLHGGISAATITEIAGPAGCGKTQFCMTLSVLAPLPTAQGGLGGDVLYIDTEGAFSAKRLLEIGGCRLPEQYSQDGDVRQLASRVHVVHVQSCKDLMNRLEHVEEDIISKGVRLLVVDSVASLVRKEFSGVQGGMMCRTDFLAAEAALLKYLAETFSIPVIVTNQITTRYCPHQSPAVQSSNTADEGSGSVDVDVEGEGSYLTAALGNTWSHCVNTRLLLQFRHTAPARQILVAKSPVAPFTCFDFTITSKGVEQEAQGQGHYEGTDPSKQAIRGRSGLHVSATQW